MGGGISTAYVQGNVAMHCTEKGACRDSKKKMAMINVAEKEQEGKVDFF